jgi:hypothetical protein
MDDDELEDLPEPPRPGPTRGIRHLAVAVLLRAVLDSKAQDKYYRFDAQRFLYPRNDQRRFHLLRTAECAGMDPHWLRECLDRTANSLAPELRKCPKCGSPVLLDENFGTDYRGRRERYCAPCRAATPVKPTLRGLTHDRSSKRNLGGTELSLIRIDILRLDFQPAECLIEETVRDKDGANRKR